VDVKQHFNVLNNLFVVAVGTINNNKSVATTTKFDRRGYSKHIHTQAPACTSSMEWGEWQVYCLGIRNVLRLDVNESTSGEEGEDHSMWKG